VEMKGKKEGMFQPIYTPPGGPPQIGAPQLYSRVGAASLKALAESHYTLLAASGISELFPSSEEELKEAAHKQALFWIGITGGPPFYMETYGHPRMRARHLPFAIDEAARSEWLRCMREALGDGTSWGFSEKDVQDWMTWLEAFSSWMVNRPPV